MRKFILSGIAITLGTALSLHAEQRLTRREVDTIFQQAVSAAKANEPSSVIAVLDREGFVLGVWDVSGGGSPSTAILGAAIREAGTAAYLSSNQNAFTSRTAQFIIQQNFPPGVRNRVPGPLVGVQFSNLPFSDVNRFKRFRSDLDKDGIIKTNVAGIPNTRLSGLCSSAPLYKKGDLVGGIGVYVRSLGTAGNPGLLGLDKTNKATAALRVELENSAANAPAGEAIALAGQRGFEPSSKIFGNNVTIDGFAVPYVIADPAGGKTLPLGSVGKEVAKYPLRGSPTPFNYPKATLGGERGELRFPIVADSGPPIQGQKRLTGGEVRQIIARAAERANKTRAGIRLPPNQRTKVWITVVGKPRKNGQPAPILGLFRMGDATFFSFDVSAQKARTALFFSDNAMAMSTRTVGFLAMDNFPPGLNGRGPGPYGPANPSYATGKLNNNTLSFQIRVSAPALGNPPNPNLPNGITVFPGGFPLYRNGVLIGAVGISGDGVDQDDLAGFTGAGNFNAPTSIRADKFLYKGARLPYVKFPRNPGL